MALPNLPGLEDIKNLGVGLAKGVGTLAASPGYLADLIAKNRGFEVKNSEEIKTKAKRWEEMTKPIGKIQKLGHAIGSLNPGVELLSPELEKLGMPSKVAFAVGLGIDILTPGPGEINTGKSLESFAKKSKNVEEFLNLPFVRTITNNMEPGTLVHNTTFENAWAILNSKEIKSKIPKGEELITKKPSISFARKKFSLVPDSIKFIFNKDELINQYGKLEPFAAEGLGRTEAEERLINKNINIKNIKRIEIDTGFLEPEDINKIIAIEKLAQENKIPVFKTGLKDLKNFYNQVKSSSEISEKTLPKTEELAKPKNIAEKLPKFPQTGFREIPHIGEKGSLSPKVPPGGGDVNKLFDNSVIKLTEVLKRAEPIRGELKQLQSEARSLKVGEAAKAQEAIGGERGYHTALSKLKGKLLPKEKLVFQSIKKELGDVDVENIFKKIQSQPDFTFFDKLDSQTAFTKLLKGEIPTEAEINLLRHVFPKATVDALLAKRPLIQKIANAGYQIINLPRTLMSGLGDFSASFRQGLFLLPGHPQRFLNAFLNQFKYFASEKSFQALMQNIKSHPTYELMREYKLPLTNLDNMTEREEKILANWGEKIPLIGRLIRATGRAYTGFLNKLRADVFIDEVKKGQAMGRKVEEFGPSLARYIGSASGRGSLGKFERAAKVLNGLFFSPRLMASRINLMNPVYYARLDPFVRKTALKDLFAFVSTGLTMLGLAKMYGTEVEVGTDWRSSDFGKIRINNTRIDIWGGFQQYARMFGQLWTGEYVSSTTGKITTLGEGYKPLTRLDILLRQLETKESPVASLITALLRGQDSTGKKINVPDEIGKRFIPMILSDIYDLSQTDPDLIPLSILSVFGVGIQSYKPTLRPGGALFRGGLPGGRLPGQQRLPGLPGL